MSTSKLQRLGSYSACDVSDALLKLGVAGAGFLPDIKPIPSFENSTNGLCTAAIASTVLFETKPSDSFPGVSHQDSNMSHLSIVRNDCKVKQPFEQDEEFTCSFSPNVPAGTPYADLTRPRTIVVLSQPQGQHCAILGDIMAERIKQLGGLGVLVDGRVRDVAALSRKGIPIWSRGISSVSAGGQAKPLAVEVPLKIGDVIVHPGDVILLDSENLAAVSVPAAYVDTVLDMLPQLTKADKNVLADVEKGKDVKSSFKLHRNRL